MATYGYTAVADGGLVARGVRTAPHPAALRAALGDEGLLLVECRPMLDRGSFGRWRRVSLDTQFYRPLATLVSAGLPLERALAEVATQVAGRLGPAVAAMHADLLRGDPLSTAMAEFPHLFAPFEIALVRAGERSGALPDALERLARVAERESTVRAKVATAAVYPALLAAVGALSLAVLLLFVVPRFASLLEGTGAGVPASTRALLSLSGFFAAHWGALVGLAVAAGASAAIACRLPAVNERASGLLTILPWIGRVRRIQLSARYARLLSTLLRGGTAPANALDEVARSTGDPAARADAVRVARAVREGASLTSAMASSPVFMPALKRLAALGEQSSRLPELLERAADILEEELERHLERFVRALEPAMTVVFGLVIGFIALSLLQAVYGVNAASLR